MLQRPIRRAVLVVAALAVLLAACGSNDDDHPPPTIGDATVVERSDPGTSATTVTVP